MHCHSVYSTLDGMLKVDDIVDMSSTAASITDHGNMSAAIKLYEKAKEKGIKPIIGLEAYVTTEPKTRKKYHLVLLAKNKTGYKNLIKLSTKSWLEGFYYKPTIIKSWFEKYHEGIICLSGCIQGELIQSLNKNPTEVINEYKNFFGDDYYIEIQNKQQSPETIEKLVRLAEITNTKFVETYDCHYAEESDWKTHQILKAIHYKKDVSEVEPNKSLHFQEVCFDEIIDKIDDNIIDFEENLLPKISSNEEICSEIYKGANKRFDKMTEEVKNRLEYEISILREKDFLNYIKIVSDIVKESKRRGVVVGPARGSAAGSLVCYCLGITDINPLKYGLIFERFLNPERTSMPDIDVDVSDKDREECINIIKERYGENSVAQIGTFSYLRTKAAIKDVGRSLGVSYKVLNKITKGRSDEEAIKEAYDIVPEVAKHSKKIIGCVRHSSVHAAGIVIAPGDITSYVPLFNRKGTVATQYDMYDIEKLGLLKIDILGLKNLSIINETLKKIDITYEDLLEISLNDEKTLSMISKGNTTSVFQLESFGMKKMLRKLKPSSFDDIIAANALYRPGPLGSGMVDDYIKRKHGIDKVKYPHPMLKSILKETYGIILYQEQVMKIANVMAGFSLGQADILRRAMGKKKVEVMDQQKEMFVKGSVGNGISKEKAEEVFELIAYFAGYGFNKSHSTAYATISMMTAYLKTHYTAKYMCSVINNCSSREEQEKILMESKKINNIHIHPPKIWWSKNITRSIYSDVYLGFNTIKGIGENLNIPPDFNDMEEDEILSYLGDKEITKNLIKSGCFGIEKNYTDLIKRSKTNGSSVNLFDFIEEGKEEEKDLFTKEKKLSLQKEFLGCFFDGHPLDKFDENNIDNTGEQEGEEKDAIVYINKINKRSNKIHFIVEDINKSEEMIMYQKSTKYKEGDIVHILYIFKDGRFIIQKMNAMKRINIENTIKSLL